MSDQPLALFLAQALIERHGVDSFQGDAAVELQRLYWENRAIKAECDVLRLALDLIANTGMDAAQCAFFAQSAITVVGRRDE